MPPKVIGPYRVLETLGSGGAGTVYRAIDRRTGEDAALKLLSTGGALDPRAARRLAREFETLQHLSHPNVVRVYDTGVYQGYPYLAMELVEGLTLRHYLSLSDDDLASDQGLNRAITLHRQAMNQAPGEDDGASDEADEADEDPSGVFSLATFGEEPLSDEFTGSDDEEEYESGPESVRRFAALAEEPDTQSSYSGGPLPYELPRSDEARPLGSRPSEVELAALNRAERVGRLKDAMLQLSEALAYIHQHGLIHRDLKPTNVMVDEDRTVRLMDFGLAKYLADDSAVTADGRLVGTFRYMAPEQVLGEHLDARTDLYGLGVILYELVAGRPPFEAKTPYELWQKILETEPVPAGALNPRADRSLARVAMKLLRKEPDDRFQTAEEVYEALLQA
ncbi:MAG: serine/threonine protein kinase [Myxococcaceae bacterium]|jgi:serine/threonine protein kinase|nr:serine/threonine protein kinase [Myxococcaceae bacterium]